MMLRYDRVEFGAVATDIALPNQRVSLTRAHQNTHETENSVNL